LWAGAVACRVAARQGAWPQQRPSQAPHEQPNTRQSGVAATHLAACSAVGKLPRCSCRPFFALPSLPSAFFVALAGCCCCWGAPPTAAASAGLPSASPLSQMCASQRPVRLYWETPMKGECLLLGPDLRNERAGCSGRGMRAVAAR